MAEEAKNAEAEALPTKDIAEEKTAAPAPALAPEVTLVVVESKTSFNFDCVHTGFRRSYEHDT
jgi:hypothetical protein